MPRKRTPVKVDQLGSSLFMRFLEWGNSIPELGDAASESINRVFDSLHFGNDVTIGAFSEVVFTTETFLGRWGEDNESQD